LSISRSLWIQLDADWRGAYYAGHALASAHPAGGLHRVSSCCTENNRTFGNAPERVKAHLMDRQTRELALLCIIASLSGMLAWALDRPLLAAAFAAQVAIMGIQMHRR
jgi:hypothetical protein